MIESELQTWLLPTLVDCNHGHSCSLLKTTLKTVHAQLASDWSEVLPVDGGQRLIGFLGVTYDLSQRV